MSLLGLGGGGGALSASSAGGGSGVGPSTVTVNNTGGFSTTSLAVIAAVAIGALILWRMIRGN